MLCAVHMIAETRCSIGSLCYRGQLVRYRRISGNCYSGSRCLELHHVRSRPGPISSGSLFLEEEPFESIRPNTEVLTGSLCPYRYGENCGVLPYLLFLLSIKIFSCHCGTWPIWRADTLELPLQSSMHQAKLFSPWTSPRVPPTWIQLPVGPPPLPVCFSRHVRAYCRDFLWPSGRLWLPFICQSIRQGMLCYSSQPLSPPPPHLEPSKAFWHSSRP